MHDSRNSSFHHSLTTVLQSLCLHSISNCSSNVSHGGNQRKITLFKKSFNKYGRSVAYIQGDDYHIYVHFCSHHKVFPWPCLLKWHRQRIYLIEQGIFRGIAPHVYRDTFAQRFHMVKPEGWDHQHISRGNLCNQSTIACEFWKLVLIR